MKRAGFFLFILFAVFLYGCATVSVPNLGQAGYSLGEDERRMHKRSEELCEILDESGHLYEDQKLEGYLNQLANQLLPEEIRKEGLHIEVKVIRDPSLNAFALPNGRIYIHTGILAVAENEAQIAALLSHEMTHVFHRHSLKQFRSLINKSAFFSTIEMPLAALGGNLGLILGQLTMVSSIYGFSKEMEFEADHDGFEMMWTNGYDVREAPKLFEHLKQFIEDEEIKEPFFFSTHPRMAERIKSFNDLIQEKGVSQEMQTQAKTIGEETYTRFTRRLTMDNCWLALEGGMFNTAKRSIDGFLAKNPQNVEAYSYLAELYRQRQEKSKRKKKYDKTADYVEALKAYDRALSLDPSYAPAFRGKGRVLQKQGKIDEAQAAFKEYLRLAPQADDHEYIEQFLTQDPGGKPPG